MKSRTTKKKSSVSPFLLRITKVGIFYHGAIQLSFTIFQNHCKSLIIFFISFFFFIDFRRKAFDWFSFSFRLPFLSLCIRNTSSGPKKRSSKLALSTGTGWYLRLGWQHKRRTQKNINYARIEVSLRRPKLHYAKYAEIMIIHA